MSPSVIIIIIRKSWLSYSAFSHMDIITESLKASL